MDQLPRRDELERIDTGPQAVSRRAFFNRTRLGLLAVAGVALFGIGTPTGGATAQEDDDEEEKKEKEKPRDKDREAKEKEKESKQKEKKKSKSSNKDGENKSNTKKKKSKNGDDNNKKKRKKQKNPYGDSPYAKYVVKGDDQYGCSQLMNQYDAQQILKLEPKDPNHLDGNRNGIACDGQDAFMDGVPGGLMNTPFDLNPVPRP